MNIVKFEYDCTEYECDADVIKSYAFLYGVRTAEDKLKQGEVLPWFKAMDALFPEGRHIEYVTALGEDMDKFGGLVAAAIDALAPKNSYRSPLPHMSTAGS